jgi:hypothetical protein
MPERAAQSTIDLPTKRLRVANPFMVAMIAWNAALGEAQQALPNGPVTRPETQRQSPRPCAKLE